VFPVPTVIYYCFESIWCSAFHNWRQDETVLS